VRYGMAIDLKKCIGCYACQTACKAEHMTPPGIFWTRIIKREHGKFPNVGLLNLPLICMQCDEPLCVDACPTGATYKRPEDGIVIVDPSKCMGCKACIAACPYGARYHAGGIKEYFPGQGPTTSEQFGRQWHAVNGVVEKCDFCLATGRLEEGREPACVEVCMTRARYFGDLDDPTSEVSRLVNLRGGFQLNPELGTKPCVFYLPDYRGTSLQE
jgi:Fe-S-cluster-containing dehydrogenase component